MKRIGLLLMMVGLLAAATPALAQDAKLVTSSGQVVSVDAKANSVVVKVEVNPGESRDVSFNVAADTKIIKDGKPLQIAGVMTGDKVTISFRTVNGKNVAVNIGIESNPAGT